MDTLDPVTELDLRRQKQIENQTASINRLLVQVDRLTEANADLETRLAHALSGLEPTAAQPSSQLSLDPSQGL